MRVPNYRARLYEVKAELTEANKRIAAFEAKEVEMRAMHHDGLYDLHNVSASKEYFNGYTEALRNALGMSITDEIVLKNAVAAEVRNDLELEVETYGN